MNKQKNFERQFIDGKSITVQMLREKFAGN